MQQIFAESSLPSMLEILLSKVQADRSYSQKKLFLVFLKCTIVSDIYEHMCRYVLCVICIVFK